MKKYIVLYNPLSKKGHGLEYAKKLNKSLIGAELTFVDMTKIEAPEVFLNTVPENTEIIFTGGDGTLNRTVNFLKTIHLTRNIYYFPAGSGNDFVRDIGKKAGCDPFPINEYLEGLPVVHVNGQRHYFVNGIGAGIDGFCCEEHDRLRDKGIKRSYAVIALQGLVGKFDSFDFKVTVDGEVHEYKNGWMSPVMFGSYYGGGFNIAPMQDRKNPEHTVTTMVTFNCSRVQALKVFLSVKNGKGEKAPQHIGYFTGKHILVEFSRPVPIQIDGETIRNVEKYEVFADGETEPPIE